MCSSRRQPPHDHAQRMERVGLALEGLSVGDSFGESFFPPEVRASSLGGKIPPPPRWRYTDDTEMALAIAEVLNRFGEIQQDELAATFARRYEQDPRRGYGAGAQRLLREIGSGADWRHVAPALFGGQGSLGNGGAMRVAVVGAYFAEDLEAVVAQAQASAAVTHAHPEGQAGAIAVAVAAAWAWQRSAEDRRRPAEDLLSTVIDHTPDGRTREGLLRAHAFPADEWEFDVAGILGNGSQITAPDTVPFCLWCAAAHLDDYPEALWAAVRVGGDIDTNCAIIGGIVALSVGAGGIPELWLRSREPLNFSGP